LIILTGFSIFGKYHVNLSGEIVKFFPNNINKYIIKKEILKVSWNSALKSYKKILSSISHNPKLVILTGIHQKNSIKLEKFGINWAFGRDIYSKFKCGLIKFRAPSHLKTILNLEDIQKNVKENVRLKISKNAGFYLCNFIYFWALYYANSEYPVLFIHFPNFGNPKNYVKILKNIMTLLI